MADERSPAQRYADVWRKRRDEFLKRFKEILPDELKRGCKEFLRIDVEEP